MANEFPHCQVLGLDLAPVPTPKSRIPSNCRFEVGDINLGLSHLQGQYDLVFARLIGLGLKDFDKSLVDMQGCCKPGGLLIWIDGDYDVFSGMPMVYRPFWSISNPNGSYASRVCYGKSVCVICLSNVIQEIPTELRRSASLGGSDVMKMESVLEGGLWTNAAMLDPETCVFCDLRK